MSSPAKRRKTNKDAGPSRSLDFFFAKQEQRNVDAEQATATSSSGAKNEGEDTQDLTDEELARRLQAQWEREDNVLRTPSPAASEAEQGKIETFGKGNGPSTPQPTNGCDSITEDAGLDTVQLPKTPTRPNGLPNTLSLQSATAAEDTISNTIPFDQSPLVFEPQHYVPDLQKQWALEGGKATYAILTRCFVLVNSTQSRIKIVDTLVNMLRTLIEGDPESLLPAVNI